MSRFKQMRWMHYRIAIATSLMAAVVCAAAPGAAAEQYQGTLDRALVPDSSFLVVLARVAAAPEGVSVPQRAGMFAGSLTPMGQWNFRVLLIEPVAGNPFIYVDINRSGAFEADERFPLVGTRAKLGRRRVRVALPPPVGSPFDNIPIELLLADNRLELPRRSSDERYLLHASLLYATAKVRIDGRSLFFRYAVSADTGRIDLRNGWQLLDTGRPIIDYLSPWRSFARQETPVFRIGNRYVSTTAIDHAARTVTIETRSPDDYKRLELYRGLAIPDFGFTDNHGTQHRLSEFRGKYVLLNFWYQGCGPCAAEIPYLRAALERFGSDNLVVIGLSEGAAPSVPAPELPAHGWVQASPESVRHLIWQWFQITSTPTAILLDRDGIVISLGNPAGNRSPLRGTKLVKTLANVFSHERRRP